MEDILKEIIGQLEIEGILELVPRNKSTDLTKLLMDAGLDYNQANGIDEQILGETSELCTAAYINGFRSAMKLMMYCVK